MTTFLTAYCAVITVLFVLALGVIWVQHTDQKRIVDRAIARRERRTS